MDTMSLAAYNPTVTNVPRLPCQAHGRLPAGLLGDGEVRVILKGFSCRN